jgi:hypothetical protein
MKRQLFISALVTGGLALSVLSAPAFSADSRGVERHRAEQAEEAAAQAPPPAPAPQARPESRRGPPGGAGPSQQAPQQQPYRGGGNNSWRTTDERGRPVVVGPPRGNDGPNARIVPPSRAYVTRPPRYVPQLPSGHRRYDWRGSQYYWGGGHWYRPYNNSYIIVGAPIGMFMPYLPGSYTTVWVGGDRYYYADGAYFTYEPVRRGYVVARSPYGDDEDDYGDDDSPRRGSTRDDDMYIYPMRGQSEKQQADDRYECHRWAVNQVHYDPTDSEYDRDDRENYDRAITACLTGRGYSVK